MININQRERNKMNPKIYWAFFLLVFALHLRADIPIVNGVWILSDKVTNDVQLTQKLYEIELTAKTDRRAAAELSEKLLGEEKAKNAVMTDEERLPLVLESLILSYRDDKKINDPEISKKARAAIRKYADMARGKGYSAYKYLFHRLRDYHWRKGEYADMINIQKEMILYDPYDQGQILTLLDYIRDYPTEYGDLKKFAKDFEKAGGIMFEEMSLTFLLETQDGPAEKIKAACVWLAKNRFASPEILLRALPRITACVSLKEKDSLKEYYFALSDLALQQPSKEDRLPVFAAALNERQKLLTVVPDLLE